MDVDSRLPRGSTSNQRVSIDYFRFLSLRRLSDVSAFIGRMVFAGLLVGEAASKTGSSMRLRSKSTNRSLTFMASTVERASRSPAPVTMLS